MDLLKHEMKKRVKRGSGYTPLGFYVLLIVCIFIAELFLDVDVYVQYEICSILVLRILERHKLHRVKVRLSNGVK